MTNREKFQNMDVEELLGKIQKGIRYPGAGCVIDYLTDNSNDCRGWFRKDDYCAACIKRFLDTDAEEDFKA